MISYTDYGNAIDGEFILGLRVKFGIPVFKKNYLNIGSRHRKGYIIIMDILPETVNLAEDSKVMRTIISKILKERGVNVIEAKDGEEAIKLHRMHNPDLTLMDINMPKP